MKSIKNRGQYKEQAYKVPCTKQIQRTIIEELPRSSNFVLFFPTSDYTPILFQENTTQYSHREQIYGRGNTARLLYHTDLNDLRARGGRHASGDWQNFPGIAPASQEGERRDERGRGENERGGGKRGTPGLTPTSGIGRLIATSGVN